MVKDSLALSLEAKGLWRRASNRWLEIYRNGYFEEADLNWLLDRSKWCLDKVARNNWENPSEDNPRGIYNPPPTSHIILFRG